MPLDISQTIGSSLAHCRDEAFAAAIILLNIETHCYVAPMQPVVPGEPPPAMVYGGARGHVGPCDGQHPVLIAHAGQENRSFVEYVRNPQSQSATA